ITDDIAQGLPTWSPDGTRLVFGDEPPVYGQPVGGEIIHVFDVATRQLSVLPNSGGLWSPRWSPDERFISAQTIVGQQLRIFDRKTETWRELAADHVDNPRWSHDGRYIFYMTEGLVRILKRVRVSDGQIEDLLNAEKYTLTPYGWIGLTPD